MSVSEIKAAERQGASLVLEAQVSLPSSRIVMTSINSLDVCLEGNASGLESIA